jgi:uncharacterized protein YegJ (DUF2314 family)
MALIILLGVLILTVMAGYWLHRRRRKKQEQEYRSISFVALLREPATFDPVVLARVASKVWKADLGDGLSEGADGFVAGAGITNAIMHVGRMYIVNCFPRPYADDIEKAAEGIADLRIRTLWLDHKAWFSCDAMGVDMSTSEEEIADVYQRLGKLFAELLDENCMLIFLPDSELAFPINNDTEAALCADDPIAALQETLEVPLIQLSDDDLLMKTAVEKARQKWPRFVAAYDSRHDKSFSIKAPVTNAGNTEFIWISVTALEGERIYGTLGNEPANLGSLKLGSKVSVTLAELNDWCFVDPQGDLQGGFTIKAVSEAARRTRKHSV